MVNTFTSAGLHRSCFRENLCNFSEKFNNRKRVNRSSVKISYIISDVRFSGKECLQNTQALTTVVFSGSVKLKPVTPNAIHIGDKSV